MSFKHKISMYLRLSFQGIYQASINEFWNKAPEIHCVEYNIYLPNNLHLQSNFNKSVTDVNKSTVVYITQRIISTFAFVYSLLAKYITWGSDI